jgi:C-terminal processing protease CtpA/Prc
MLASSAAPSVPTISDLGLGLVIASPRSQYRIAAVVPESRAARAGVKAGDVVGRINHVEPRTRAQVDGAMESAGSKPILLEIERDRRRVAIVIPETPPRLTSSLRSA